MAPVLRQIYDQMPEPKWVISMGVCASSGGMFNNYAIVQGVDHIVPVDIYLPGCPPRPEMLMDSIFKLHDKIMNMKLGADRDEEITELEEARLKLLPLHVTAGGQRRRERTVSQAPGEPGTPAGEPPAVEEDGLPGSAGGAACRRAGGAHRHVRRARHPGHVRVRPAPGAQAAAGVVRAAVRRLLRHDRAGAGRRAARRTGSASPTRSSGWSWTAASSPSTCAASGCSRCATSC